MEVIVYSLLALMALLVLGILVVTKIEQKPLNKHVLLAMSWLVDSDSVGLSHLVSNSGEAAKKYFIETSTKEDWYAYYAAVLVVTAAATKDSPAREQAWDAVDQFFASNEQNKQDYLDRIGK
jgi:cobalamin synthase